MNPQFFDQKDPAKVALKVIFPENQYVVLGLILMPNNHVEVEAA